jgi:hypothetical protein
MGVPLLRGFAAEAIRTHIKLKFFPYISLSGVLMDLGFRYRVRGRHDIPAVQAARNAIIQINDYDSTLNAYKDGRNQIHTDAELPPLLLDELKKDYKIYFVRRGKKGIFSRRLVEI